MKLSNLHLGNVVKLRSGGPAMVVEREPAPPHDVIHCVWSDAGTIHRDQFPRRTLDKVKA
jgi:uncharacterized protein YodC (DUF2158 family)